MHQTVFEINVLLFVTDLEWKIIYVGSAESVEHDQILETVLVGPVPAGCHKFVFEVTNLIIVISTSYCD